MRPFREVYLEYRHNDAMGMKKPSVWAHNSKNPFKMNKKKLHTVGEYTPMEKDVHTLGKILIGDRLLAILAEYGIDFEAGRTVAVKNSPYALKMFTNKNNQPTARVVEKKDE
jgi:hypothetical protein